MVSRILLLALSGGIVFAGIARAEDMTARTFPATAAGSAPGKPGAQGPVLTPEQRESDFNQLLGIIRSTYSMVQYKRELFGLDLDVLEASYRARLATVGSDDEYYDLIQTFVTEFKDAHFSLSRPSTQTARLGFSVVRADGRAIISEIDTDDLPPDQFPFSVGDELVALDGKPATALVEELLSAHGNGREESAIGFATRLLPERFGAFGRVPSGPCRVTVLPAGQTEPRTIVLSWIVRGKPLPGLSFFDKRARAPADRASLFIDEQRGSLNAAINPMAAAFTSPTTAAWSPTDGHPLKTNEFSAFIVESPKGPLGYVRIPTMVPGDEEKALAEFRDLLKEMWVTRGLIVDVADNPGGSVTYVYGLASMLTDKPVELPQWSTRATRSNLNHVRQLLRYDWDAAARATLEFEAQQIEEAVKSGLEMTPFGYSWGITNRSQDAGVNYTKPIVVLISDQCYSGGDMFPSLLQDNRKVVLFGSNTAGAGGSVGRYGPLSYTGCNINMTQTIWRRQPANTFIENVGAKPDVTYEVTQEDVKSGYQEYRAAYIDTLLKLID